MLNNIYNKIRNYFRVYLQTVGLLGLLRAIIGKISGKTFFVTVSRIDCKYPFVIRIPSSDVAVCHQVFIEKEYDFQADKIPLSIVDAGANIGLASIYFANKYPSATIIAIEPELLNYQLLQQNSSYYSNIKAVNAALWNANGEIRLVDPGRGKWGYITKLIGSEDCSERKSMQAVRAVTIDSVIESYDLIEVDILKIDIEGAEKEVFNHSLPWIDKINFIIIEVHEHFKEGCYDSVYNGTRGFDVQWRQGEKIYLSRTTQAFRS